MGAKIYTKAERAEIERKQRDNAVRTSIVAVKTAPTQLLSVEKARQFLAQSKNVDEIRDVADKAKAVALYLRSRDASIESHNDAVEIQLRCERRLGELNEEMPKAKNAPGPGRGKAGQKAGPALSQPPSYAEQGIDKRDAAAWRELSELPEKEFEAVVADARERGERLTTSAVRERAKLKKQSKRRDDVETAAKVAPERARVSCQDALAFLAELKPASVDLLLTDPPYSTDISDVAGFSRWIESALVALKPTGRAYICIGAYPIELLAYLERLRDLGWIDRSQVLVWTYRNTLGPSPTHDYKLNWQAILYLRGVAASPLDCPVMLEQFSVQDINAPDGRLGDRYHAWQKPSELAERLVRHSTKPGDLVVDPFACTGTFLLAAAKLGRQAIGCDISAENLTIAEQRGCLLERP